MFTLNPEKDGRLYREEELRTQLARFKWSFRTEQAASAEDIVQTHDTYRLGQQDQLAERRAGVVEFLDAARYTSKDDYHRDVLKATIYYVAREQEVISAIDETFRRIYEVNGIDAAVMGGLQLETDANLPEIRKSYQDLLTNLLLTQTVLPDEERDFNEIVIDINVRQWKKRLLDHFKKEQQDASGLPYWIDPYPDRTTAREAEADRLIEKYDCRNMVFNSLSCQVPLEILDFKAEVGVRHNGDIRSIWKPDEQLTRQEFMDRYGDELVREPRDNSRSIGW